jgi:hypothetical protein
MTYPINKTDGTALITPTMPAGILQDGTLDTSTGVTLIGRNFPSYGEIQNENFIKLLQNFANAQPPNVSQDALLLLPGTLWFDTANNILNVYDGIEFIPTSQRIVSALQPTATSIGDQWWDSNNQQLRAWNGTDWELVGPAYTASQGKSGAFVESITDTTGNTHVVVSEYVKNIPVSVTSIDGVFTVNTAVSTSYTNFTTIQPGLNLASNVTLHGTATNSNTVGGLSSTVFARNDIATNFASDVTVAGNLAFTGANISTSSGSLNLQNKNHGGNIKVFLNTINDGNVCGMSIDGTTGRAYVYSDPTAPLGIATKGYADDIGDALNTALNTAIGEINANVNAIYVDYIGNITTVISSTNANLNAVQSSINANVTATNAAVVSANVGMNSYVTDQIAAVNSALVSGIATAENMSNVAIANLNSTLTAQISNVQSYINTTINPELVNLNNSIAQLESEIVPLAPINSPSFTGVPSAPTPASGDNSTNLATTAFIQSAIAAQKFNYTVSNNPPSGGNDGDFWFQIG